MEAACRMGGLLELSDSKSYEDLKKSDKHYDQPEDHFFKKPQTKNNEFLKHKEDEPSTNMMTNSTASESTPTDSGVQLLDSEISEMSVSGFDSDGKIMEQSVEDPPIQELLVQEAEGMTNSDIANSNVNNNGQQGNNNCPQGDGDPKTEETENIVYRRKIKKKLVSAPKKRVSFHEDILKNTRTDNIHIERGFITYKPSLAENNSRYSWCGEGDYGNRRRNILQRNACSDVIDYGNTEVTPTLFVDNSGVFEYLDKPKPQDKPEDKLYICSCSGSDCSLTESEDSGKNYDKNQKSASCDCIGSKDFQDNIENGNYYYSEPNIGEGRYTWSKEKKPKTSCLKKTSSDILQEPVTYNNIKNYNRHKRPESYHNLFGSLKNIYKNMSFGLDLPERGVPEGSEDVMECLPEHEVDTNTKTKPFLSKSFDAGFENYPKRTKGDGHSRTYIHDVDAQLRRKNTSDIFPERKNSCTIFKSDVQRNKFIVNCESTVFEHTGVSYGYDYQNFISPQEPSPTATISEPTKDSYVPLKDKFTSFLKNFTDRRDSLPLERRDSVSSQKVVTDKKSVPSEVSDNESVTTSEVSGGSNSHESATKGSNKHLASPLKKSSGVPRYEKTGGSPKHINRFVK